MIRKNISRIESEKYIDKYGSLTERMRTSMIDHSTLPLYSNIVDLIRTLITVLILVRLREYSGCQISLMIIVTFFKQAYILHARPYCTPLENRIALFNEYLISLYLYGIILLTDYNQDDELRLYASYVLIGTIGLYTLINMGNFLAVAFWLMWRSLKKSCKILCRKIKAKPSPEPFNASETTVALKLPEAVGTVPTDDNNVLVVEDFNEPVMEPHHGPIHEKQVSFG